MLGSITPLGERGRGQRYGLTVAAFAAGAVTAGAAIGALLGLAGSALPDGGWRLTTLLGAVGAGLALDAGVLGLRVPTVRRQVNEDWLGRYRGWVYGLGFGGQLGAGVATIVTTAATYAALLAALLAGSWAGGLAVGAAFGAVRAVAILPAARVRTVAALGALSGALGRLEPAARRAALAGQAGVAVALLVAVAA
jgi:MFS family permease